jgi:hypothetical protein
MNRKLLAVIPLAVILVASGCVTPVTDVVCDRDCRETTVRQEGDIGQVSTIDMLTCKPNLGEECWILDAHWDYISPREMEGDYRIHCKCCSIV